MFAIFQYSKYGSDMINYTINNCDMVNNCATISFLFYRLKTSLHAGGTHLAVLARGIASYLSVALETRDVDHIAGLVHAHVAQCLLQLTGFVL